MPSNAVDQPDALVTTDQDVLGGEPVFAGTRVLVSFVVFDKGAHRDRPHIHQRRVQSRRVRRQEGYAGRTCIHH